MPKACVSTSTPSIRSFEPSKHFFFQKMCLSTALVHHLHPQKTIIVLNIPIFIHCFSSIVFIHCCSNVLYHRFFQLQPLGPKAPGLGGRRPRPQVGAELSGLVFDGRRLGVVGQQQGGPGAFGSPFLDRKGGEQKCGGR